MYRISIRYVWEWLHHATVYKHVCFQRAKICTMRWDSLSGKFFRSIIPIVSRISTVLIPTTLRLRQEIIIIVKLCSALLIDYSNYNAWAIAFENQGHPLERLNVRLHSIHAGRMSPMLLHGIYLPQRGNHWTHLIDIERKQLWESVDETASRYNLMLSNGMQKMGWWADNFTPTFGIGTVPNIGLTPIPKRNIIWLA